MYPALELAVVGDWEWPKRRKGTSETYVSPLGRPERLEEESDLRTKGASEGGGRNGSVGSRVRLHNADSDSR